MQKILTSLRILYSIAGLFLFGYGSKTILTQEISAAGSRWRGAGWVIHGEPAVLIGILIGILGVYILLLVAKQ